MHDIDRTLTEMEYERNDADNREFEYEGEFEFEFEGGYGNVRNGYSYEYEGGYGDEEVEEMELASELLTVSSDQELDQFLGSLIKKAGKAAGKFINSATGKQLGSALRTVARKVVPKIGTVLGTAIGGPAGGAIGGKLASMAGQHFGLELEGLSPEDQEFEVSRQFVRFAKEAARNASYAPPSMDPQMVARRAMTSAARQYAPGLLRGFSSYGGGRMGARAQSGRWIRQGNRIVLLGA